MSPREISIRNAPSNAALVAKIVRILKELSRDAGLTVIMVSHNLELAGQADRQFEMRDGVISERG